MGNTGPMRRNTAGDRRPLLLPAAIGLLVLSAGLVVHSRTTPHRHQRRTIPAATATPSPAAAPAAPSGRVAALSLVSEVVGLGDSVTVGANCSCTPFVSLLATALEKSKVRPVNVANEARNGLTSGRLLTQLRSGRERAVVSRVTLVTIGANDFDPAQLSAPGCTAPDLGCYQAALARLRVNMAAVLDTLLLGGGPHGPILVTGYWNVLLDGDVGAARGPAYQRDSAALTSRVNAVLQQVSLRKGVTYVDLYTPFKEPNDGDDTPLLAADGDHPSAAGHAVITTALMSALSVP